jgi:hypothetical protein
MEASGQQYSLIATFPGKETSYLMNRRSGWAQSRSQPLPKLERRTYQPVAKSLYWRTLSGRFCKSLHFCWHSLTDVDFLKARKSAHNNFLYQTVKWYQVLECRYGTSKSELIPRHRRVTCVKWLIYEGRSENNFTNKNYGTPGIHPWSSAELCHPFPALQENPSGHTVKGDIDRVADRIMHEPLSTGTSEVHEKPW